MPSSAPSGSSRSERQHGYRSAIDSVRGIVDCLGHEIVSTVTHERRTPVGSVSGFPEPPAGTASYLERECGLALTRLYRTKQDVRRLLAERDAAPRAVTRAHHDALLKLALAAEYKDGDTSTHDVRPGRLSELVPAPCGPEARFAPFPHLAAPVHVAGRIDAPDSIPERRRLPHAGEREVVRAHRAVDARRGTTADLPSEPTQ